jgi:DNA polymerase-3 subunit delta'
MILFNDIKGQDNAIRYLRNIMSSGRIAGSYLFSGPQGVGRALTAKAFIAALICPESRGKGAPCGVCPDCMKIETSGHPDVIWIKPVKNKNIKIEEIRAARDELNLKPFGSLFNACVIEDAHMMTREASNALLKILEEPPARSIIVLISNKKELMPETVISRCMEVRFRPLTVPDTKELVMGAVEGLSEEDAFFMARFSQGSPGKALEMIEEGVVDRKDALIKMVDGMIGERSLSCVKWDQENKDLLLEDLEVLLMFFRDIALGKEGAGEMVIDDDVIRSGMFAFFGKCSADRIYNIIERLIEMKRALMGNVNPKLVAQALPGMLKP